MRTCTTFEHVTLAEDILAIATKQVTLTGDMLRIAAKNTITGKMLIFHAEKGTLTEEKLMLDFQHVAPTGEMSKKLEVCFWLGICDER